MSKSILKTPRLLFSAALGATMMTPIAAHAGSEDYTGEVMMTAANFCPRGTTRLDGTLMSIQQYQALFSLLGATFGGDGRTTFGMPELRGRTPVASSSGSGIGIPLSIGQHGGTDNVWVSQIPMIAGHAHAVEDHSHTIDDHSHTANVATHTVACDSSSTVCTNTPVGNSISIYPPQREAYAPGAPDGAYMAPNSIPVETKTGLETNGTSTFTTGVSGGGQSLGTRAEPFLGITFCMTMNNLYPPRN